MVLIHHRVAGLFGFFGRDSEEVESATCVAVFLRSECSAEFNHARSNGLSHKPVSGTLTQNVLELLGIVGSEKNVQLAQSRANPRV